jgi:hypothetical protein
MTNMKPPQEGRNTGAPSLRGLQGRSATGLNGQAAKEEVSALWRGGWMPEDISGVPAGRSVFHLTSPLIGLLARNDFPFARDSGVFMAISSWRNSAPHDKLTVLGIQENFRRISPVIKDGT